MREWARTIAAVDEQIARALDDGLFEVTAERRYVVADVFDAGEDFVEVVSEWGGTRIPSRLVAKIRRAEPPVTVEEEVRLRLLARKP
jgi:hypothetical protein